MLSEGALKVLPRVAVAVPSKGALKVLPKIADVVPPKRALDITKCLRWEKYNQGELEVLPKRTCALHGPWPARGGVSHSITT